MGGKLKVAARGGPGVQRDHVPAAVWALSVEVTLSLSRVNKDR